MDRLGAATTSTVAALIRAMAKIKNSVFRMAPSSLCALTIAAILNTRCDGGHRVDLFFEVRKHAPNDQSWFWTIIAPRDEAVSPQRATRQHAKTRRRISWQCVAVDAKKAARAFLRSSVWALFPLRGKALASSRSDCLVAQFNQPRLARRRGCPSQIFAVGNSAKVRAHPLAALYAANLTAAYDWQPVNARGLAFA